ncbi:xylulokinase [Formosimonas limnophila]|uniref:Xylulose kinase n=1 Tax=Formosimonas limnophila TaxID=1384487 RepID=A0A8J3CMT8_9BURK|nr:xylulokinase [Formosimonas limnophila]GHA70520.1 xylulokinase [Formosimonas limnophila]
MYIGLDFGTSEVKALLMSAVGVPLATSGSPLTISRPHPMWSEQNPEDWWAATLAALAGLRDQKPEEYAQTKAIGLSGQMHGAVLLDEHQQVLRPAILWNDVRSHAECIELTEKVPNLYDVAGNLAMPGFTAPKLLWVAKHEPEVFAATRTVLLPKDYIRFRLTGAFVSDMSDAAGTLWLDVAKRDWSDELLAATGLTRAHMPRLVEGSAVSANLSSAVAAQLGLSDEVKVAGGGGDNAASAVGIGAVAAGDGFISLGTSGVLFVVNDQYRPNPQAAVHAFCHALPNRWHQMSVMLSAASGLHWICQTVGVKEADLLAEVVLLDDVMTAPLFLPYLSGERTPHNDPYAQGVFFGLTHETSRAHLAYAVIEGVAFGLLDGMNALRAAGTQVHDLSLVGGGSRSAYWAQLLANALQVRIHTHVGSEAGGALGAARLGALADGLSEVAVCTKPPIAQSFEPVLVEGLAARYEKFKLLYQTVKPLFQS